MSVTAVIDRSLGIIYVYIYIYIESVLKGWLIVVSNVFIYSQRPNPQYGGSGGGGDHIYKDISFRRDSRNWLS